MNEGPTAWTLEAFEDIFGVSLPDDLKGKPVTGVEDDSRRVIKGCLFVALRGRRQDGRIFIPDALQKGAVACCYEAPHPRIQREAGAAVIGVRDLKAVLSRLLNRFYRWPSRRLKTVGVTGTNGKTTVTYLLEAITTAAGLNCGVIGTVNYRFGDRLEPAANTTPSPVRLQQWLAAMADERTHAVFMEVSSHALDQDRVAGVDFSSAIFTNLSQDHLDYHGTMEHYFRSKERLFRMLNPGTIAVINTDDPYGARMAAATRARVISYGFTPSACVRAEDVQMSARGASFDLVWPHGRLRLQSCLIGRYNIMNILAACAWALAEGIPVDALQTALKEFRGVPGRLQRHDLPQGAVAFVDYAHTEDGLRQVLETLKELRPRRLITVFGCGGDRDHDKRPRMGKVAVDLSDRVIVTSDNPRFEEPNAIIEDILKGVSSSSKEVIVEVDRQKAIEQALSSAQNGDFVLIAGKGHERVQDFGHTIIPFDDNRVVSQWCVQNTQRAASPVSTTI